MTNQTKKPSSKELVLQQRDQIVSRLITDIEQNEFEWVKPWQAGLQAQNPTTGTIYAGGNRLHLAYAAMERGYKDPRWVTFKQGVAKGWHLKKGSKSALVEFWKLCSFSKEHENEDGEVEAIRVQYPKLIRGYRVFNLEDWEGDIPPLPEPPNPNADEMSAIADQFIKNWEVDVIESTGDKACYRPYSDVINMPAREWFSTNGHFLRVLLHEMTHSTGHPSRLNRFDVFGSGGFGSKDYAKEELIAELGSLFTSSSVGLPNLDAEGEYYSQHAAYLQSWLQALKGEDDPGNWLFSTAAQAQKASDMLLEAYNNCENIAEVA